MAIEIRLIQGAAATLDASLAPAAFLVNPQAAQDAFCDLVSIDRTISGRGFEFRPHGSRVGTVAGFGLRVEVRPWVSWPQFHSLVSYAAGSPVDPRKARMVTRLIRSDTGLEDAICRMLFGETDLILRLGLARQYVRRVAACRALRGRVRWSENFPWRGARARELVCRYHEMSFDNIHNRLILAGLRCASSLARQAETVQRALEHLRTWESLATQAPVTESDFDLAHESYNRLTDHYRVGHSLSRMLVSGYLQR